MILAISGYLLTLCGFFGWCLVILVVGNMAAARKARKAERERWRRIAEGMRERRFQ